MNAEELKAILTILVENQAYWRANKALQYPDDDRNEQSARALEKLARSLAELSVNDPIVARYWAVHHWHSKAPEISQSLLEEQDATARVFVREYGFHRNASGDAKQFLADLIELLAKDRSIWQSTAKVSGI